MVCLQETRAQSEQRKAPEFSPEGYQTYYVDAERKGYSGVAIYSRREPDRVIEGLGWKAFDREGRWVQADYGRLSVVSVYMPSGTSGDERQDFKYRIMKKMKPLLKGFANGERDYILCGDFNIAHKEIDIKNWRGNRKNSGFLPDERAWLDWLLTIWAWSMCSGIWMIGRSNTPGGQIEVRPGPRTWAGASITRLQPPRLPRVLSRPRSLPMTGFLTMRR